MTDPSPSPAAMKAAKEVCLMRVIHDDQRSDVVSRIIDREMGTAKVVEAMQAALEHVRELREAWRVGAIHEIDGGGGTRSNRNVDVEVALRDTLATLKGDKP